MTIKEANELKEGCNEQYEFRRMFDDGTYGSDFQHCEEGIGYCPKCKAKAKEKLEGLVKEYRSLKRQHCDNCDKEECQTCKPEFDKLREEKEIYEGILK